MSIRPRRLACDANGLSLLAESECGELGSYLMTVSGETATSYWVEAGVASMLGLFVAPISCREAAQLINEISGAPGIDAAVSLPAAGRTSGSTVP